jgi:hypothetical protein
VWNEAFDGFCPLWLDDDHGGRAMPTIRAYVQRAAGSTGAGATLEFFGKAMNTFVVSMMDDSGGARGARGQPPGLYASERALQGYCAFHHLLLALCARRPEMRAEANRRVEGLLAGKASKAEIPDLGVLLALLTVSDRTWQDSKVAWAVLGECLDRNVRWLLPSRESKGLPHLRQGRRMAAGSKQRLLEDWLEGTRTSQRVLMFQAYFLSRVGRPAGATPPQV